MYEAGFYFDVERPDRLSRFLIFVKILLAIPHLVILYIYGILANFVRMAAWICILIIGRCPRGLWSFLMTYLVWIERVSIYIGLLRDEYPPFANDPYPMVFRLDYPQRSSRFLLLARLLTVIPLALWAMVINLLYCLALPIAWICILITGHIPQGLWDFMVGAMRYSLKVTLYANLLTDAWPGFSRDNP